MLPQILLLLDWAASAYVVVLPPGVEYCHGGQRLHFAHGGERLQAVHGGQRLQAAHGGERLQAAHGGQRLQYRDEET